MRNTAGRSKVHDFSLVPKATIPRAKFDRSHGNITTMDEGILYPIFWDHVLPGDTFNLNMTAVARLATPIFPIMDNIRFQSFFFLFLIVFCSHFLKKCVVLKIIRMIVRIIFFQF